MRLVAGTIEGHPLWARAIHAADGLARATRRAEPSGPQFGNGVAQANAGVLCKAVCPQCSSVKDNGKWVRSPARTD